MSYSAATVETVTEQGLMSVLQAANCTLEYTLLCKVFYTSVISKTARASKMQLKVVKKTVCGHISIYMYISIYVIL